MELEGVVGSSKKQIPGLARNAASIKFLPQPHAIPTTPLEPMKPNVP